LSSYFDVFTRYTPLGPAHAPVPVIGDLWATIRKNNSNFRPLSSSTFPRLMSSTAVTPTATEGQHCMTMTPTTTPLRFTGALTIKEFCEAYRLCREKAYQEVRARRLRAVKLGRKTLILRADAEAWAAGLPELRAGGREQACA